MGRGDYLSRTQGGYSRPSSQPSRSTSQPRGGHHDRGNQIQENIKNQREKKEIQKQNQINENNRRRIEEMRNAQSAQDNISIAERLRQEKDDTGAYETVKKHQVTTKHGTFANQSAANAYQDSLDKQKRTQDAMALAKDLRKAGVTADQLTDEEKDQLSDLQFMQDEGVYGGVSGYEAEVNKMKKAIVEGGAGYEDALRALAYLSGTRGEATPAGIGGGMVPGEVTPNEELAKISALGVQEYLKRKTKGDPKALTDIITGKTKIEGLSPDFFKNFAGPKKGINPYTGKETTWSNTAGLGIGTDEKGTYIYGNALGYDPTGAYTWSDIESDEKGLYQKYLKRGELWDDPLSGLFPKSTSGGVTGDDGGGYGYGYGYGGGGRGGGGGYGYGDDEDPLARGYQRGKVGPGGLLEAVNQLYFRLSGMGKKRGGIVSLLELR